MTRHHPPILLGIFALLVPEMARATEENTCSSAHVRAQVLKRDAPDKLLERRVALRTCSNALCPGSVIDACSGWLQDVEMLIPSMSVRVIDVHGEAFPDASITIDGKTQAAGVPLDVDPGDHVVVAAAGGTKQEKRVVLRLGEKDRRIDIVFQPLLETVTTPAPKNEPGWPAGTWVSYGLGVVGLGVGIWFLVSDVEQIGILNKECSYDAAGVKTNTPTGRCSKASGRDVDSLHQDRLYLGAGFAVAALGGALGSYLLLTRPSNPTSQTTVRPLIGLGWLGLGGRL